MVEVVVEHSRGCGFRSPSKAGVGIYLMGGPLNAPCERLPFPVESCPTCGAGIKPTRGWTWIDPIALFGVQPCGLQSCRRCPLGQGAPTGRHGLLWVGSRWYPSPYHFLLEARHRGISRKIGAIPREFVMGETVVYLAHREAVQVEVDGEIQMRPGIITAFRPEEVHLVVGADTDEEIPEKIHDRLDRLQNRLESQQEGCTRVLKVIPLPMSQQDLFDTDEEEAAESDD